MPDLLGSVFPPFGTDSDVERTLHLHPGYCAKDRLKRQPVIPGWVKFGSVVRYPRAAVLAAIEANTNRRVHWSDRRRNRAQRSTGDGSAPAAD